MIKQVTIDEKAYTLRSDAFFPIFYRDELGREFFRDVQGVEKDVSYFLTYITYGMIRYYDSRSGEEPQIGELEEWLEGLSTLAISLASADIVGLISKDHARTSRAKKKNVK